MLKKIVIGGLILLALVAVVVLFFLGPILRPVVESRGSETLKTKVTLDKLSLSVFAGKIRMSTLVVQNPEGFSPGPFMVLERFEAEARLGSLLSSVAEMPEVVLDGLQINLEVKGGRNNLKVILDNTGGGESGGETTEAEGKDGGKRFRIDTLALKNIRVSLKGEPVGEVKLTVGDFTMHDIGTHKSTGATLAQVTAAVLKALAGRISDEVGNLGGEAKRLFKKSGLLDDLSKAGGKSGEKLLDKIKKPFKRLFR